MKIKLFEDLELDGCMELADVPQNATIRQFAEACSVPGTGDLAEWRTTFRSTTGSRAVQEWPRKEVILRLAHWSVNNA